MLFDVAQYVPAARLAAVAIHSKMLTTSHWVTPNANFYNEISIMNYKFANGVGKVSYLIQYGTASRLHVACPVLEFNVGKKALEITIWNNVFYKKQEERYHRKRFGKVQSGDNIRRGIAVIAAH